MDKPVACIITTGGTIDSFYNGLIDTVEPYKESVIPNYIGSLKLYTQTDFAPLCMKDSREISAQDREKMLKVIRESDNTAFIITHGTYTMPDTARYLERLLTPEELAQKTIVITGSMVPHNFNNSDAGFNLGFAYAIATSAKGGVYICMNGRVFDADEVAKNVAEGRFVSLFNA